MPANRPHRAPRQAARRLEVYPARLAAATSAIARFALACDWARAAGLSDRSLDSAAQVIAGLAQRADERAADAGDCTGAGV